jgi:tRNA 2-thiouridine synthesizing protein A
MAAADDAKFYARWMVNGDGVTRHRLDVRGRACPIPIVELMRAIRGMTPGETIEVVADDRAFPADVAAWCTKTGNHLLTIEEEGNGHRALVRKERS